jgi:hypothetical protein
MKKYLLFILLAATAVACNQKPQGKISRVLVVKNFMQDHPKWRLLNDTIVKEITIGYKGLEMPVQLKWRRAEDENGCLKIAMVEFTQVGGDTSILLHISCLTTIPASIKKAITKLKNMSAWILISSTWQKQPSANIGSKPIWVVFMEMAPTSLIWCTF